MSYVSELRALELRIAGRIQFKRRLEECRMPESQEGVEVFYYNGEIYDREKYVLQTMRDARNLNAKYSEVRRTIISRRKELEKGGKCAELIAAELSAYLRLLPEMKKPWFYIDDI